MNPLAKYIEVHATNLLVARKIPFRTPVSPHILNGYTNVSKEKAEALRIEDSRTLHQMEFLFMPVVTSPVLVYLIGKDWSHRCKDSFEVLYMLWIIGRVHSLPTDPYYLMNKDRIDKARETMLSEMTTFDAKQKEYFHSPPGNALSKEEFIRYMQPNTIERIHIMEKYVQSMFIEFQTFPPLLTPMEFPPVTALPKEAQAKYGEHMEHYYHIKQVIRSDKLKKQCGYEEETVFFPSLVTKNYDQLMYEYYQFLKE